MKYIVSEKAIRELIRETMMNPSVGWQSTTDLDDSPVSVSSVVDPSAAATDPGNENFKPSNRKELRTALSGMIDSLSDDCAEQVFDAMKAAIEKTQEEDKDMKTDKKVEEAIRLAIRKIISEAKPRPKFKDVPVGPVTNPLGITPTRYPAGMAGGEATRKFEKMKAGMQQSLDKTLRDAESAEMLRSDEPAAGRTRKNVMQTDVGGSSFKEIAEEMGYASESGAKQAVERILSKVKYRLTIPEDELDIIVLTTLSDAIEALIGLDDVDDTVDSAFTPDEIEELKNNPETLASWPEFREKLDKRLTRAQKRYEKSKEQGEEETFEESSKRRFVDKPIVKSAETPHLQPAKRFPAGFSEKSQKKIDRLKRSFGVKVPTRPSSKPEKTDHDELSDEDLTPEDLELLKQFPEMAKEIKGYKG